MFKDEQKHPFYKPLWVRVSMVVTIVLWLGFELYKGDSGLWIALAAGMLGYAVYTFFITWPKDRPEDDEAPRA
ncbi:DUF3329 domain-containing protein [Aestuariivirga sp.]|uniref:DUF3329 domain-containing protein n=1 Tax=Aestuariivirga sp. TaxID=2650926 RepID=UPI003BA8B8BF